MLKTILKLGKHRGIKGINDSFGNGPLSFSTIEKKNVCSEINKLNYHKFIQDTDISVKIFKENADLFRRIFSYFLEKQLLHLNFHLF